MKKLLMDKNKEADYRKYIYISKATRAFQFSSTQFSFSSGPKYKQIFIERQENLIDFHFSFRIHFLRFHLELKDIYVNNNDKKRNKNEEKSFSLLHATAIYEFFVET